MRRGAFIAAAALAALAALSFATRADDPLPRDYEPLQRFPVAEARITSSGQEHLFRVWIARTPRHRAQGLMYVHTLDADRGMLFVFPSPQFASFWMKNTYVPLDMLFVRGDGRIVNIAARTLPLSTDPYVATEPVRAVLELAGGTTERLGIRPGDRLAFPPRSLATAR